MLALAFAVGLLLLAGGHAARGDEGVACREQAAAAERAANIPAGLLLAIGRRESGRFDARTGDVLPWPWSVNREGEDHVFATEAEAIAYVEAAQREGSQSIDVGCFQINLKYHPDAFATLSEAFDPAANAAYAARFLRELYAREGTWEAAVADYHSATPELGGPYRDAVFATWRGQPASLAPASLAMLAPVAPRPIGLRYGPPAPVGGPRPTRIAFGVRIWEPIAASAEPPRPAGADAAKPAASHIEAIVLHRRRGLPRVFTPGGLAH